MKIWDVESGREVQSLKGHTAGVPGVAWHPDGKRLASGDLSGTVRIWDVATGKELLDSLRGHASTVLALAWNLDGTRLATASFDNSARIWDPATGRELATLIGHTGRLTSIAWRPDGKQLATGGGDGTARIWSAAEEKAKALLAAHRRSATAMAWSPDGRRVASGGDDGTIVVRDTATGKLLELKGPATPVNSLAWSRQGKLASAGNDFTVRLWDPDTGAPLAVLPGHEANVSCVAWSPDGTRLASAVGVSLFQRRQIIARPVYIWDISDPNKPTLAHTLRGHEGEVNCVAWSPDGRRIASAGFDGRLAAQRIRIWDATTGKPVGGLPGPLEEIHGLAWSPDGQHIASAGSWGATFDRAVEGSIRIHHLTPGRPPRVLRGHTDAVRSVAWSPDPEGMRLLSAGDDRTLKVWNSRTGEELLTLTGHAGAVNAAAWSPDGMRIASAGADGSVRLWDATLGHEHELSPGLLKVLDDRIAAGNATARDYRLRGELRARLGRWEDAAADFAAAAEGQPESAPDSFMTPWWIVGPYPAELRTIHPPEKDPDPLRPAAAAAGSGSLRWQLAVPGEDNGVDLGRYFSGAEHISCYVYARIWSPRRQEVFILAGSDDTLRLWLNGGEPIHEHPNPRVAVPDQDVVPAALEPGWNTLLAKVVNETGAHGLFLRLSSSPVELARAWERKNQWDRALEQWDRAVKQEPDNPWLLVQRSRAARNAKRLDRARADTSALLQKYPDNVALLRSRAELYQAEQRWPDAIADATAAAKLRPEDWELQLELGRLHARAPEKVPAVLDHPAALIGRGLVLQETGRAKEAEADFVRAFQRLKDTPQAGEQFAQVFTNLADAAIRKGDLASAIMLLGRIVQARPNDVPLLEKRAHLYARRGQWKEAAEDFSRVIELDPSEHWHWYRLAPLLVETGQLERYRRHCREMRERFGNADAMTSGRAIQASLFLADAADDWKALADQARQNARDTNLPVRVSAAGMFAHRAGRFAEAIDTINASLASLNNPLKCRALCFLAMAYQAQNQPDEARGALDQVERLLPRRFLDLSANPLDASWIDWLSARILHREAAGVVRGPAHRLAVEADQLVDAKDLSGALERLTKAIALKADDPDLYYKRGDLYARRRQWKEAAADFAKRIELKPDESLMWLRRAPLLVMSGDADGYRRHCRAMLERFGETRDPRQADQTAKSCLLLPDAVADPRLPIALAERAVADESTRWAEPYFQAVRGLAAYRAGRFDDAIRRLEENQQAISGQLYLRELNQALLAMAYHRTNQPEKARKALDEAAGGIDRVLGPAGDKNDLGRGWNDLLNAAIIRREAEALLKKGDASHY
jgi:WD40 repeat protein/tetratricopeptide (TPR) repeat protein